VCSRSAAQAFRNFNQHNHEQLAQLHKELVPLRRALADQGPGAAASVGLVDFVLFRLLPYPRIDAVSPAYVVTRVVCFAVDP